MYVNNYTQTCVFRSEITSWQSTANLPGIQILYDPHKNYKEKNKNSVLKCYEYQFPENLLSVF